MTNHIRALSGGCVGRPLRLLEFWGPSDSPSLPVRDSACFTSWCGWNFPISPVFWKPKGEVIDGPVNTMLWVAWKTEPFHLFLRECKWMKLAQLIFLILCLGLLWKPWVAVFSSTLKVGMCHLVFLYYLTSLKLFKGIVHLKWKFFHYLLSCSKLVWLFLFFQKE